MLPAPGEPAPPGTTFFVSTRQQASSSGSNAFGPPSALLPRPPQILSTTDFKAVLGSPGSKAVIESVVRHLKLFGIKDVYHWACVCRQTWEVVSSDAQTWLDLYVSNDPIVTPEVRKRLTLETYCNHSEQINIQRCTLKQSVWMRTCCLLYSKPQLVLLYSGKDPIVLRRLGQPEAASEIVNLGINYHLEDYLDDEEKRFVTEFPQVFQVSVISAGYIQ